MIRMRRPPKQRLQKIIAHHSLVQLLQQGNLFLRCLLNAMPVPVFYKDLAGKYLGVNRAFEIFYGKSDADMVGKTVFDIAPPELAAVYHAKDREFFANPSLQVYETKVKDHSGKVHEVIFHKAPFVDSDGILLGMIGVILDVSRQIEAEKYARRAAEVQTVLRQISEATLSALAMGEIYAFVHQWIGRILPAENFYISHIDEAANVIRFPYCAGKARLLPGERPIGRGLTEYVARTGKPGLFTPAQLKALCEAGEVDPANAPPMQWLGAPLVDLNGKVMGLVVTFLMDQPESFEANDCELLQIIASQFSLAIQRRKSADELAESEARYRNMVHQAPEALLLCDPRSGEIIDANLRFTEQFGYDLQQDSPLNVFDLLEADRETIRQNLDSAIRRGIMPVQRRIGRHRNGSLVHLERSASLIQYGQRELLLVTVRDVSADVRREQMILREAQLASWIQKALLPEIQPSPWVQIAPIYQPHGYVGGDLYFLDWRYGGQLLRGFLVDTAGHGLGTALHTSALHILLREINAQDLPLGEQVAWLNRRAYEYFDEASFAAALAFEIDLQLRLVRWVCAGISEVRLATSSTRGIVARSGMFLGIEETEIYDVHSLPLNEGDCFYFLTDGLTDRLVLRNDLPFENFDAMVHVFEQLAEAPDRKDDATALCIQIKALPAQKENRADWPKIYHFQGYGDYQRYRPELSSVIAQVTGKAHSLQEVAINEALANALECRDGVARQHRVKMVLNRFGSWFVVRVRSSRLGFAGNSVLRRLRANPEYFFEYGADAGMGRGLPIMLSTTDRMLYNEEGNELLLAWRLAEKTTETL